MSSSFWYTTFSICCPRFDHRSWRRFAAIRSHIEHSFELYYHDTFSIAMPAFSAAENASRIRPPYIKIIITKTLRKPSYSTTHTRLHQPHTDGAGLFSGSTRKIPGTTGYYITHVTRQAIIQIPTITASIDSVSYNLARIPLLFLETGTGLVLINALALFLIVNTFFPYVDT